MNCEYEIFNWKNSFRWITQRKQITKERISHKEEYDPIVIRKSSSDKFPQFRKWSVCHHWRRKWKTQISDKVFQPVLYCLNLISSYSTTTSTVVLHSQDFVGFSSCKFLSHYTLKRFLVCVYVLDWTYMLQWRTCQLQTRMEAFYTGIANVDFLVGEGR